MDNPETTDSEAKRPQSTSSALGSAFGVFSSTTQSVLGSVRGRNSTPSTGFSGFNGLAMTAGLGAKGSKTVASGINRSVSAAASGTVNTLRHLGENRFALPSSNGSTRMVHPGCARWLNGKDQGSIAVVCGGAVQVRTVRQSNNPKVGKRRPSVISGSPSSFSVPIRSAPTREAQIGQQRPGSASRNPGSYWLQHTSRPSSRKDNLNIHPLSFAEIETNAPYQPFHTDRRINLFAYNDDTAIRSSSEEPWVFGEDIPATQISIGTTMRSESEAGHARFGKMENEIRVEGNAEEGRQVVMTTRFKKKRKGIGVQLEEDDGEIFEDDCEFVDHADQRV